MKIAILNDTHIGVRNDNAHFAATQTKFFDEVFFPYMENNHVDEIWHAGDLFDRRKYINFVTLDRAKKTFLDRVRKWPMRIIAGNHDIYYKSTNEINSLKPILAAYDNIEVYDVEPKELEIGGRSVLFLPWINTTNEKQFMDAVNKSKADILVGHLELKGFEVHKGHVLDEGMEPSGFARFKKVLSGHYHTKSTKYGIDYLGTQFEMTWADYDDQKGFHILDTETLDLTFIPNPRKMFHKIFYNDVKNGYKLEDDWSFVKDKVVKLIIEEKTSITTFDMVFDGIFKSDPMALTVVEDMSEFFEHDEDDIQDMSKDTLELLSDYIDGLEISQPKKKIKTIMKNLYNEGIDLVL